MKNEAIYTPRARIIVSLGSQVRRGGQGRRRSGALEANICVAEEYKAGEHGHKECVRSCGASARWCVAVRAAQRTERGCIHEIGVKPWRADKGLGKVSLIDGKVNLKRTCKRAIVLDSSTTRATILLRTAAPPWRQRRLVRLHRLCAHFVYRCAVLFVTKTWCGRRRPRGERGGRGREDHRWRSRRSRCRYGIVVAVNVLGASATRRTIRVE